MTPELLAIQMMVTQILESAAEPAGSVHVMLVPDDHWFLREGGVRRKARAARNAEGDEIVVLNRDMLTDHHLIHIVEHEMAHIITWRRHGEKVREHGPEFLKICKEVVSDHHDKFCKGN